MSAADASVTVYGATYSVYVRIARIALHEKGVPYDLVPIDVFAEDGLPADYRARHPFGLRERARMNQIIAMLDNYAYRPMVWDVYVQRVETAPADEARIAAGLEKARTILAALSGLPGRGQWLAGPEPSLADFHAAPMFALFGEAPEGARLLADFPEIHAWWERVKSRPSVTAAGA